MTLYSASRQGCDRLDGIILGFRRLRSIDRGHASLRRRLLCVHAGSPLRENTRSPRPCSPPAGEPHRDPSARWPARRWPSHLLGGRPGGGHPATPPPPPPPPHPH